MELEIKRLTKELKADYLLFFDNMIHKDNPEWSICYCYHYHFTGDISTCTRESNRSAVIDLIDEQKLSGYLVYDNDKPVGWCNTNNRSNYQRIGQEYNLINDQEDKVCSIVCFLIHPDYRRKGIAKKIIERIIADYSNTDYDYIEAYPRKESSPNETSYKGPLELYKKFDFKIHREEGDHYLVRKAVTLFKENE